MLGMCIGVPTGKIDSRVVLSLLILIGFTAKKKKPQTIILLSTGKIAMLSEGFQYVWTVTGIMIVSCDTW